MQILTELIDALNEQERTLVLGHLQGRPSLPYQLLGRLLAPAAGTYRSIQADLKISPSLAAKTGTQAKDLLLKILSDHQQTDFDRIAFIRQLLFRGKMELAWKLAGDTEKHYEEKQQWQQLELLYIEAYRYCHMTGNQKLLEAFVKKRTFNAARLHAYIELSGLIIRELVRLEGFKLKPTVKDYFSQLKKLEQRVLKLQHDTLTGNVYTLQYLYLTRFTSNMVPISKVVGHIEDLYKQKGMHLQDNARLIAINTHLNFLSQYVTRQNPHVQARKILPEMETLGTFVASNLCYAMCEYSLHVFDFKQMDEWLEKLRRYKDEGKFKLFVHAVTASGHFAQGAWEHFKAEAELFFSGAAHQNFPDMEIQLRLLELILTRRQADEELLAYRTEALRLFMMRHVSKDRYRDEWAILNLFKKKQLSGADVLKLLKTLERSPYHNISFLKTLLHRNLIHNQ